MTTWVKVGEIFLGPKIFEKFSKDSNWKISIFWKIEISIFDFRKFSIEILRKFFENFGSHFFFAYLHSSGHNFMNFLSILKNSGANNISRIPCIHLRGDNTAGDNQKQLWAHQMSVTLYMYLGSF